MTREQRVGLFVILALVIFVVFLELTTGFMPFKRAYTVYGLFENVRGVQEGTDISVSGVNVGKVKGLAFKDGKVEVAMTIPEDVRLFQDAKARLETPLMGPTASLNILPGSPKKPPIKDGGYIDTEESPSIQDVLGRVDKAVGSLEDLAKSFEGKEGPFAQLNTFFKEHEKDMGELVKNFSEFSEKLAEGKGTLGKLMEDETLYNRLNSTFASLQKSLERFEEGKGTLGKLMEDDTLYNKATATVDRLDSAIKDLAEVSQKVNRGEGTLGKLVTDDSLYRKAEESLANMDRATKGMEDQGPISAIGAAVGAVF